MTEPPTTEGPQRSTLVAVVLGGVIGIVFVLTVILDASLADIAVVFVPILIGLAFAAAGFFWAKRRGHLD